MPPEIPVSSTVRLPSLSIVIVNWNSKDYVRQCLRSIAAHGEGLATQILVVDGGSFDGCDAMLASEFPEVGFVQSPENVGFARSNNLGFERATSEAVLLLNPDTELLPGALRSLLEALAQLPRPGILGPVLLNSDGTLQTSSVNALPTPLNQLLDSNFLRRRLPRSRLWNTYRAYSSSEPTEVEAVSGACMLLWSAVFREIGGFTSDYFMYAEDMDLCHKTRRAGYANYHIPQAKVTHHGGGSSSAQPSRFSTIQKCQALRTYMRLNHGPGTAVRYQLFMLGSSLARMAVLGGAWLLSRANRKQDRLNSLARWRYIASWSLGRKG